MTTTSKLAAFGNRLKNAMSDTATGPLRIAAEALEIAETWPLYKKEAGMAFSQWIVTQTGSSGQGLAFFKKRAQAITELGAESKNVLHHEVAVYVVRQVPEEQREKVKRKLTEHYLQHNRVPASYEQGKLIIRTLLGWKRKPRVGCLNCARLTAHYEALLVSLKPSTAAAE